MPDQLRGNQSNWLRKSNSGGVGGKNMKKGTEKKACELDWNISISGGGLRLISAPQMS